MSTIFLYRLLAGWLDMRYDPAKELFTGLRPHQRLLLASGGSLTLDIEHLLETDINVDLIRMEDSILDLDAASYLQTAPGVQVCERVVWLKAGEKKLVYAHTIFLLERTDPAIIESLNRSLDEPLGKVLGRKRISFTKSRMEAGIVVCGQAAADLDMAPDTRFVARRYVLADSGTSTSQANRIMAAVTEVFSPEIIPVVAVRPQA